MTKFYTIIEVEANNEVQVEEFELTHLQVKKMFNLFKLVEESGVHVQFVVIDPSDEQPKYIDVIDNKVTFITQEVTSYDEQ